jgi:hypothetical protein
MLFCWVNEYTTQPYDQTMIPSQPISWKQKPFTSSPNYPNLLFSLSTYSGIRHGNISMSIFSHYWVPKIQMCVARLPRV